MNIKLKAVLLVTLTIFISLGILFLRETKLGKGRFHSHVDPVIVQLAPSPIIINKDAQKDDALYKLLLNKESRKITLSNVNFDIESIFIFTPASLKNLSVCFSFNKETNRVEFKGHSNNSKHLKVSGHYTLTSKNNIKYYLNIREEHKTWIIDSVYSPAYKDNKSEHQELVTGNFSVDVPDLFKAFYNVDQSSESPVTLQGSFIRQENFLDVKNIYLKAKDLEANISATIKGKKISLDVAVNEIDLNEVSAYLSKMSITKVLYSVLQKISIFDVRGELNCSRAKLNGIELRSFFMTFLKNKKTKNSLEISKLKFSFPNNVVFNSSGKILHNKSNISMKGAFNVSDLNANILAQTLGVKSYSGTNLVSVSSNFELTPTNLSFKTLKLKEGLTKFIGDVSFSKNTNSKILLGNVAISDYDSSIRSFIQSVLYENALLSKTGRLDYEAFLERGRAQRSLKDITLTFHNIKTTGGIVKKISTRYLETPESIELKNFQSEDPDFNVEGNISFQSKEATPYLDIKFEGSKVNMAVFNDLIFNPFIYQFSENRDDIVSVPRFSITKGSVSLNIKDPDKRTYLSAINCKAQLDKHTLTLGNNCLINLFDSDVDLQGTINLGNSLGYNINFSHKDANASKLVKWLTGRNRQITGVGKIDMKGYVTASGFDTDKKMMHVLKGVIELKSDQVSLTNIDVKSLIFKYGKIKNIISSIKNSKTEFHNVTGKFDLEDGMLKSKDLVFITKDNIHGRARINYKLNDKDTKGILSLAYFDKLGKIDGFNINFYGDIRNLNTKLGAYADTLSKNN
ncbi:MAG: hypothetical protein HRU36_03775 [Rickettsiales bacterium]|nr:hypothetical protein [Rickettsiales bacterium]